MVDREKLKVLFSTTNKMIDDATDAFGLGIILYTIGVDRGACIALGDKSIQVECEELRDKAYTKMLSLYPRDNNEIVEKKVSPKTVTRILTNYLIYSIKEYNKRSKEVKETTRGMNAHTGFVQGVSDCVAILKKKYDKEYRDSLKKAGMLDTVWEEHQRK